MAIKVHARELCLRTKGRRQDPLGYQNERLKYRASRQKISCDIQWELKPNFALSTSLEFFFAFSNALRAVFKQVRS